MTEHITDPRYPVLYILDKSNGHMGYIDLLNAIRISTALTPSQTMGLLMQMRTDSLISGPFRAYSSVHLEPSGTCLLLQLQSNAKQDAAQDAKCHAEEAAQEAEVIRNRKQQFRHDFLVAAFSAVIPIFAAFLIEHFFNLTQILHSVFSGFRFTPLYF